MNISGNQMYSGVLSLDVQKTSAGVLPLTGTLLPSPGNTSGRCHYCIELPCPLA